MGNPAKALIVAAALAGSLIGHGPVQPDSRGVIEFYRDVFVFVKVARKDKAVIVTVSKCSMHHDDECDTTTLTVSTEGEQWQPKP